MLERSITPIAAGRWLAILGIGEDGVEGLSAAARALIRAARLVVGGARHLRLVEPLLRETAKPAQERIVWPTPIADAFPAILARRGDPVAVLASGDPFCYGIGSLLAGAVPPAEIMCVPAPSAFSLAAARLGWALQNTATISFCGRPLAALAPLLQPASRIFALSADETTPASVAEFLRERGFGVSRVYVLEALGGGRERIRATTADQYALDAVDALNLVAIEVVAGPDARLIPLSTGLPDDAFEHDGQITKREIRAVTLSALAPRRGEMLWDIGCGSGSVAIEWMLRSPANRAIGIEQRPERAARAARNAIALGVPDFAVVTGAAPEALADLPKPDAVFIGCGTQDEGVMQAAWAALRSGGRTVVNAVTIDTEAALFDACERLGGTLTRLSVERLDTIGTRRSFRPAMTVTQWSATKP
jgi:precorrin-6Y C5,15-methyltransferase (decarboxylating)